MKIKELGRLFSIVVGAALCLSLLLPIESYSASSFKDIKGHWAESYIESAVSLEIIKGYPDGRFLPDEKVSRAEFISMLNRALGNTSLGSIGFYDVSRGAWYYNDVGKAVTAGFVSGFGDGSFRPNSKITRQEAAVMLARIVPSYGYSANLKKFSDHSHIASWAYMSLQKISGKNYISGYTDGKVHPLDSLTRAQAAKIISDIMKNEKIITSDPVLKKNNSKLSGAIYSNNVTIHKDLDDGSITIDNCTILGKLLVQGGGEETVTINNSRIVDMLVNRTANPVRVYAKGETVISNAACSRDFILQSASLSGNEFGTGFEQVGLTSSAKGSLQGNFPKVLLDGSSIELKLLSGTIKNLEVTSTGKKSEIFIESKGTIEKADVYGESYFRGLGQVLNMQVYAKGITYETKPKNWTIHSGGETPVKSDPRLEITFDPAKGRTNVYLDAKISITYNSPVKERDGSTITNGKIQDIVSIRKGSDTGTSIGYSGTINSAKTLMTLTPSSLLEAKTRYYVVVKSGTMRNEYGERNEEVVSYFTTGANTEKLMVTYLPANGDVKVGLDEKSFSISFSEGLRKNDKNNSVIDTNDKYLKENVVLFREASKNIKSDDYAVSIDRNKKVITVSLKDSFRLKVNTRYTLGINSLSLKTDGGVSVPSSSASWTTVDKLSLASFSAAPYDLSVDFKATPNVNGTIYAVLVDGTDIKAPTAAQIKEGKDGSGNGAVAKASVTANASRAATLRLSGDRIARDTSYRVYGVLFDRDGNVSDVVSPSMIKTDPLKLKSLKAIPVKDGIEKTDVLLGKFNPDKFEYEVFVENGIDFVRLIADPEEEGFPGDLTVNGQNKAADISLKSGRATGKVIIKEEGKTGLVYTINIREKGSPDLQSMTINGDSYDPTDKIKYILPPDYDEKLRLIINSVEEDAKIRIESNPSLYRSGETIEWNLASTTSRLEFIIESTDGNKRTYEILFDRKPQAEQGTDSGEREREDD